MKRKIVIEQESCSGCPFFKVEISNPFARWHCKKIGMYTSWFSEHDSTEGLHRICDEWFKTLCSLEEIK